ncbi:MAG: hypothetical protein ACTHN5_20245 [Phycisphaerae bacterium]
MSSENAFDALPPSNLEKVVSLFRSKGVRFLVVGGQAEFLFGSSRLTVDVDVCYARDRENIRTIVECLREIHARLRGAPDDVPFRLDARSLEIGCNFTFKTDLGDVDILGYVEPVGDYEKLLARHESYEVGSTVINTISLEDLLTVKRHVNRDKDQESIAQLLTIKRLREKGQA